MVQALIIAGAFAAVADPYEFVTDANVMKSEAVEDLVKELGADPKAGRKAAMRLVRFGRLAVPALARAVKSDKLQVRFYAANALDLIRARSSTDVLFEVLGNQDEHVMIRRIAARAMGRDEYVRAVPLLVELLVGGGDAPGEKKADAPKDRGDAKGDAPPPLDLPTYMDGSPLAADEEFRFEVVRSLSYIGDGGGVEVLVDALKDSSARIREVAAQGLGDQRAAAGIPGLRGLLLDPEASVAAVAARALSRYGKAAAAATPDLIDALGRADIRIQRNAKGALAVITGYSFSSQTRWREWWARQLEKKDEPPPLPDVDAARPRPDYDASPAKPRRKLEPGETPPALRPPWEWDDESRRTTPE